jgi:hypothetical protein
VPIVLKPGSINILETYGPVQARNGIAVPVLFRIFLSYLIMCLYILHTISPTDLLLPSPVLNFQGISNQYSKFPNFQHHAMYRMNRYIATPNFYVRVICKYYPKACRIYITYFNDLFPFLVNIAFVISVGEEIMKSTLSLLLREHNKIKLLLVYLT